MHELRRKDRAITQTEALALLNRAEYGILSTISQKDQPYGVPLNFCVIDGSIYFHCAHTGQKIDSIEDNQNVSFCVVGKTQLLPEKFSTKYESVIAFGVAEEVFAVTKQIALEKLVQKYSPEFIKKGKKYIENSQGKTRVFRININHLTGKARK
jgi:nitroimidazol reductase NimA-like FMN-containing flavoprotein (pyridoxamine 5'-phosphate oxidase superfamily)